MGEKHRLGNPATWSFERREVQRCADKARTLLDAARANLVHCEDGTTQRDFLWLCPNGDEARLLELTLGEESGYRLSIHEEAGVGIHRNYTFFTNRSEDKLYEETLDEQTPTGKSKLQLCGYVGEVLDEGAKVLAQEMHDYNEVRLIMAKTLLKGSFFSKNLIEKAGRSSLDDNRHLYYRRQAIGSAYERAQRKSKNDTEEAGRALTLDDFEKAGNELIEEVTKRIQDTPHN